MEFPASELKDATNSFNCDNVIGEGGFGKVYRGVLRFTTVAVKVLTEVSPNFLSDSNFEV